MKWNEITNKETALKWMIECENSVPNLSIEEIIQNVNEKIIEWTLKYSVLVNKDKDRLTDKEINQMIILSGLLSAVDDYKKSLLQKQITGVRK